jgi:hypothetical protein
VSIAAPREHAQSDTALLEQTHELDKVWEVPAETVEFPHHQRVAFTERLQARGKPGAIVALSGGAILIQVLPIDASSHKRVHLQVENL